MYPPVVPFNENWHSDSPSAYYKGKGWSTQRAQFLVLHLENNIIFAELLRSQLISKAELNLWNKVWKNFTSEYSWIQPEFPNMFGNFFLHIF